MKTAYILILCIVIGWSSFGQPQVTISDFEKLDNSNWIGSLMYINYKDGQEITLRTTMQILLEGNKILMHTQYSDEPKANSKESIKIRKDGAYLGNEELIEKNMEMGILKLVTKYQGKDNNKTAMIYKTYTISENEFTIEKRVDYLDSEQKILRNRYSYQKVSG